MQAIQDAPVIDEFSRLKQQLAERELAVMRSVLANTELQQKLADIEEEREKLRTELREREQQPSPAEALAEIARLKKEWSVTQKAQLKEHAERRAEVVRSRGLLHQAQKRFEDESRARRSDAAHASATIARLERELAELRAQASNAQDRHSRQQKTHWKVMGGLATCIALAIGLVCFWPRSMAAVRGGAPEENAGSAVSATNGTGSGSAVKLPALPPDPFRPPSGPEFAHSLSRLNEALGAFPGQTPQQILREVHLSRAHEEPGLCAFQWNNGQPSLMFSGDEHKVTITSTLNRCAQAIEIYGQQKNAPASQPGH